MRFILGFSVTVLACGPLTPPATDAGTPDAGPPGVDAGTDAGSDAGFDAGFDAGQAMDAGPCDGGFCAPERLTAERIDPWDLAVDGTYVYWLEYGLATNGLDGQVMRQRKDTVCLKRDGGCAEDLNTRFNGRFRVDSMTLAGNELCWAEHYANDRDVVCQGLTTNAERFVARNQSEASEPIASGGELLWVNRGNALQDGQVMQKSLSAPASTLPTVVAGPRASPTSVAVAAGHVVWAEAGLSIDAGAVLAQPMDGGAAFTLASGQRTPLSVVACGGALYWVNYRDNTVQRGTLAPGSGAALVGNQKQPFQLVCDATTLYWLNAGVSASGADGELWQAKLDGSEAAAMVQGIPLAWALTLDDEYVYYIAQGTVTRVNGELWRIRKHR